MKTILITGVSTGIGYGAAKELVRAGHRVIGTVRKAADGERLKAELGANFIPLILDVTDGEAVAALPATIEPLCADEGLNCLINNAGMAISGPTQLQSMADFRQQFEVNVFGLVAVTQALLPLLGATAHPKHPPGRIINVTSVGGLIAAPFIAAYVSTKHAIEGFSHSLRRELLCFGIPVIIVGPGSVKTAIWGKGGILQENPYAGTLYDGQMQRFRKYAQEVESKGFTPEQFGKFIRHVVETPRPKTRYAFVPNKFFNWTIPILLPHNWVDRIMAWKLGLRQKR